MAANAILPNGPYTNNLSNYDLGTTTARWNAVWAGTLNVGTSTWSLNSGTNGRLSFFDAASGSGNERLSLTTSGLLGIGTTTPQWALQVAGTRSSFALSDISAGSNLKHWLLSSMGGVLYVGTTTDSYATSTPAVLTMTSAGRLGIGTSSPMSALDVKGDINFSGKLYEDGNEFLSSMIAPFAGSCPTGWSEYTAARGRAVVGTPSGGTNAGTVGTALTNLGTRTVTDVAAHTHAVDPPSTGTDSQGAHTHGPSSGSFVISGGVGLGNGGSIVASIDTSGTTASAGAHTHTVDIASFTSGSTGVASVDVTMPYIQLTYCQKTAGADIAEWIPASEDISKETIVSIDPNNREKAVVSSKPYDNSVIGIVATKPGWLLGQEAKGSIQLALAGRVPVRVSLKNGEIKPGDPITTSSIPGVGMKATRAGPIVGKAMEALNETSALNSCTDPATDRAVQCGTALVFVNVSWYSPTADEQNDYASQVANSFFEPLGFSDDLDRGDVADLYYQDAPREGHPDQFEKLGHVGKADGASWKPIVGVISTTIGGEGELLRRVRENNKIIKEIRLIASGKADMKIAPDSPDILPGDSLVLSKTHKGLGTKAVSTGPVIARALEDWSANMHKNEIAVMVDASWYDPHLLSSTDDSDADSLVHRIFKALVEHLVEWFAEATNGIADFFAKVGNFGRVNTDQLCTKKSDGAEVCASGDQLAAILAGTAAGAPAHVDFVGAPAGQPASGDASTTLTVNGNNPVVWQLNIAWQDNLGALFTHDGRSETIYSTSTVEVAHPGTTTTDYWAIVPATQQWLHATRPVVIPAPANDNAPATTTDASTMPPVANDNSEPTLSTAVNE